MAVLECGCGDRSFRVRIQRAEAVGLLTCARESHNSLLLDSRDHWHHVVQSGKPRESRCRCGGKVFEVELDYELREDARTVRSVAVRLRCVACELERIATTLDIDYEPTDQLVERPLDPCPDPWLKARHTEWSAFWLTADLAELGRELIENRGAICWWVGWREPARRIAAGELRELSTHAQPFDLYFARQEVELALLSSRDAWMQLPVIHVPSPISMRLGTCSATLYFIQFAEEFLVKGSVRRQESDAPCVGQGPRGLARAAIRFSSWRQDLRQPCRVRAVGRGDLTGPRQHALTGARRGRLPARGSAEAGGWRRT